MFVAMEADDRLNWFVKPYISSFGNDSVILYTDKVNLWLLSHTLRLRKSCKKAPLEKAKNLKPIAYSSDHFIHHR